jgi:putative flippase GtrA
MLEYSLARYVVVGAINTVAGLAIIFGLKAFAGAGDVAANLVGYAGAVLLGFALNRRWTFRHAGAVAPALAWYFAVLSVAYLLNLATVLACIHALDLNAYLAQCLGILPYTVIGYCGSRLLVFRTGARFGRTRLLLER